MTCGNQACSPDNVGHVVLPARSAHGEVVVLRLDRPHGYDDSIRDEPFGTDPRRAWDAAYLTARYRAS